MTARELGFKRAVVISFDSANNDLDQYESSWTSRTVSCRMPPNLWKAVKGAPAAASRNSETVAEDAMISQDALPSSLLTKPAPALMN